MTGGMRSLTSKSPISLILVGQHQTQISMARQHTVVNPVTAGITKVEMARTAQANIKLASRESKLFRGGDKRKVLDILTNELHGMDRYLPAKDLDDLALFIVDGQFDFSKFIDVETNLVISGDSRAGSEYYDTVCAKCHGVDGDLIKDMTPVGIIAHKNPWEVMHKIINGQPGEKMPSMRAFGMTVVMDIMAYVQTLKNN